MHLLFLLFQDFTFLLSCLNTGDEYVENKYSTQKLACLTIYFPGWLVKTNSLQSFL